jgi:hypothetical protein
VPEISEPQIKGLQATAWRGDPDLYGIGLHDHRTCGQKGVMGTHASWTDCTEDIGPVQNADDFDHKRTAAFIDLGKACKSSFQSGELKPVRPPRLAASFVRHNSRSAFHAVQNFLSVWLPRHILVTGRGVSVPQCRSPTRRLPFKEDPARWRSSGGVFR